MSNTYFVYETPLPWGIYGCTSVNPDNTYTILLNDRYDDPTKQKTLKHELEHIEQDDFNNGLPITTQELRAEK